ncbi:hypothetical protein OUZ56_002416 [Daphnia magna]|uniref:Uncharacterized protein n=1 Tax=Daphnia magna TaxID=35525 RepID=A0ABR0A615_9CRUS|nr:hypothetical protein OUZ56_002416 [Daphnia magna]
MATVPSGSALASRVKHKIFKFRDTQARQGNIFKCLLLLRRCQTQILNVPTSEVLKYNCVLYLPMPQRANFIFTFGPVNLHFFIILSIGHLHYLQADCRFTIIYTTRQHRTQSSLPFQKVWFRRPGRLLLLACVKNSERNIVTRVSFPTLRNRPAHPGRLNFWEMENCETG